MKRTKKFLVGLLAMLSVFSGSLGLVACGGSESSSNKGEATEIEKVYAQYVIYAQAEGQTPLSYEEWLASIKGEKGDKGDTGATVMKIGNEAFQHSRITSIVVSDSVTSIGDRAFRFCGNLTSIEIPDSVTSIGDYAFAYCYSLTSITFNGKVEEWNAISKDYDWNFDGPATKVVCSDGEVAL